MYISIHYSIFLKIFFLLDGLAFSRLSYKLHIAHYYFIQIIVIIWLETPCNILRQIHLLTFMNYMDILFPPIAIIVYSLQCIFQTCDTSFRTTVCKNLKSQGSSELNNGSNVPSCLQRFPILFRR